MQEAPKKHKPDDFYSIRSSIKDAFHEMERSCDEKNKTSIPSGFKLMSGFKPGELIIIGGRPASGKTTLGLNIARHVGLEIRKPVLFFSFEMTKEDLALRLLCSEAMVNLNKAKNGFIEKEDWSKLCNAASNLSVAPIFIDDTTTITIEDMRNKAKRFKKGHKEIGAILIDYLQLLPAAKKKQGISEVCRALKAMAKEVKAPVIALSQVSRSAEKRKNKRPTIADLRGIDEKNADVLLFI